MGGCQNHGPLLGPLNTGCGIILRTQRGTIILTTYHVTRAKQTWSPACVTSTWSVRRFCERRQGKVNFCEPKEVVPTIRTTCLQEAGKLGEAARRAGHTNVLQRAQGEAKANLCK